MSGYSSAWLERLLWEQKVARSNRVTPTIFLLSPTCFLSGVIFTALTSRAHYARVKFRALIYDVYQD